MADSVIWLAEDQDQINFWIVFVNTKFDPMLSWSWSWADFSLIVIPFVNTGLCPLFHPEVSTLIAYKLEKNVCYCHNNTNIYKRVEIVAISKQVWK